MRWIWTLAIACVIAATGVRSAPEDREDCTSQHLSTPAPLHHLAARPHGHGAPDTRTHLVAALPARLALAAPLTRATSTTWSLPAPHSHHLVDSRSRGPPPSIG